MTPQPPDFDQLVGAELEGAERARLRHVHSLLLQAGPPPELSPSLESGPTLAMSLTRRPVRIRRQVMLLAAALVVLALAFLGGYLAGNSGSGTAGKVMRLTGTPAAPNAFASLQIQHVDAAGNWPMKLSVKGLPELPTGSYYEVYLMRNGRPYAPCGSFKVASSAATVVQLNAPYRLQSGDTWDVMRTSPGRSEPGVVVLKPVSL